jgi:energy-coupling factor transport system permease protein
MAGMITYREKDCFIHRLSGLTKLVFFLLWTITSMLTYDTRVLCLMLALSLVIFGASRTEWKQVASVFKMIMVFLVINLLAIYAFSPEEGCRIYKSTTVLRRFFRTVYDYRRAAFLRSEYRAQIFYDYSGGIHVHNGDEPQ